jgi:hypothetical protein
MTTIETHRELIALAEKTNFEDGGGGDSLQTFEDKFEEFYEKSFETRSKSYELFIFTLAEKKDQRFYEQTGWRLLKWLLKYHPDIFKNGVGDTISIDKKYPIHTAILYENNFFLDSLLEISNDKGYEVSDILSKKDDRGWTCVLAAIGRGLPCAGEMVKKCSTDTILVKDKEGLTPLHAAAKMQKRGSDPKLTLESVCDMRMSPNTSKPRAPNHSEPIVKGKRNFSGAHDGQRANEGRSFDPHDVYKEMKAKARNLETKERNKFMANLLTAVNNSGMSPYQIRIQNFDVSPKGALQDDAKQRETKFQEELKSDIFSYLGDDVSLVKKALYGTEGKFGHTSQT